MTKCVINFAKGGWYPRGQQRLHESLEETRFDGALLFHSDEADVGAPPHQLCPYGFKPYALLNAVQLGYTHVLWTDASVWAIRNIEPMFRHIDEHGWMFFLNTCTGNWTSDACLEAFGVTRDEAMQIPMLMGICMGFNMTCPKTQKFLELWMQHALNSRSFPGAWTNKNQEVSADPRVYGHRHDQSAASLIAHRLEMDLIVPHETFFQYYENPQHSPFNGDFSLIKAHTVMVAQGL